MRLVLFLVALAGCGVREAGLTVDVTARVTPASRAGLQLDLATLAVERVELVPCSSALWRALSPISTAYAHGGATDASPRVSTPAMLIDLTSDEPQVVTSLAPPPGAVCGLGLLFAPSTAAAMSQGTTLYFSGVADGAPLRLLATGRKSVTLPLDSLSLDEAHPHLALDVRLTSFPPTTDASLTLEQDLASLTLSTP